MVTIQDTLHLNVVPEVKKHNNKNHYQKSRDVSNFKIGDNNIKAVYI